MPSFSVLLPPGWSRLDLTSDPEASTERFAQLLSQEAPLSRRPQVRALVREHVGPLVRACAESGVTSMVIPTSSRLVNPLRPAITFRGIPSLEQADPLAVLQALVVDDSSAALTDIEGLVAVRTHATVDATKTADAAQRVLDEVMADSSVPKIDLGSAGSDVPGDAHMVSSRVRYTMGDPDDRKKWIDVQMAVDHPDTPEAENLAKDVIELFDAVMSTFRWVS